MRENNRLSNKRRRDDELEDGQDQSANQPFKLSRPNPAGESPDRAPSSSPESEAPSSPSPSPPPPDLTPQTPPLMTVTELMANVFDQTLDRMDMVTTLENIAPWSLSSRRMDSIKKFVVDNEKLNEIRDVATRSIDVIGISQYGRQIIYGSGPISSIVHESDVDSLPIRRAEERDRIVSNTLSFTLPSGFFHQGLFEGLVANVDYVPPKHLPKLVRQVCRRQAAGGSCEDLIAKLIEKAEIFEPRQLRSLVTASTSQVYDGSRPMLDAWAPKMKLLSFPLQHEVISSVALPIAGRGKSLACFAEHLEKMDPLAAAMVQKNIEMLPVDDPHRSKALCDLTKHLDGNATAGTTLARKIISLPDNDPYKPEAFCNLTKHLSKFNILSQFEISAEALTRLSRNQGQDLQYERELYPQPHFRAVESLHYLSQQRYLLMKASRDQVDEAIQHYVKDGPLWAKALLIAHAEDREACLNSILGSGSERQSITGMRALTVRVDELSKDEKARYFDNINKTRRTNYKLQEMAIFNVQENSKHFSKDQMEEFTRIKAKPPLNAISSRKYFAHAARNGAYMNVRDIKMTVQNIKHLVTETMQLNPSVHSPEYKKMRQCYRDSMRAVGTWYGTAISEAHTAYVLAHRPAVAPRVPGIPRDRGRLGR